MMKFTAAICAGLLINSTIVLAAPTVSGVAGSLQEGSTVTVTGSGFGSFGGQIISWDDFESQVSGDSINGSTAKIGGTWTTQGGYSGSGARFDTSRAHSGSKAAHLDWSIDSNTIRAFGWAGRGPFNKLFISYWRYMAGNYTVGTDNHKQFYLFGTSNDMPQLMPLIPAGTDDWGIYNNVGDASLSYSDRNNINRLGWTYGNTRDKFQRWDFWVELNDVNVANGTVKAWLNGKLGIENHAYETRRVSGAFDDFRLGHMAQGFSDSAEAWFDDVYVATTQARVELCDKPAWNLCTEQEIQVVVPESWTSGQVTIKLRKGGLDSIAGSYLYVVDANGSVNTTGFPVGDSVPQPMPPSGVSVE